jgi:hypothetical protein
LANIATLCRQKGYQLAISNPCFEIWLLLHLRSLDEYTENAKREFRENSKIGNRNRIDIELANISGGYNKNNPNTDLFIANINQAIDRARNIDDLTHRWPQDLGSRMYLLALKIIGKR